MKVIFIEDVARVGRKGEVKEVANGYATNVLIPKKQAVIATPEAIKKIETEKKNKEAKKEAEKNQFLKAFSELENILKEKTGGVLEITGLKNDKGHLFSAISKNDIVDAIYKILKVSFNPDQVNFSEQIKKHGEYEVELKDKDIKRKIKILVK